MVTSKYLYCIVAVTVLASLSLADTLALQLSCSNRAPIGQGKIEISGAVEVSKNEKTAITSYIKSRIAICDETVKVPCEYVALDSLNGAYQLQGDTHQFTIDAVNLQNKAKLTFNLAILPRAASVDQSVHQIVPSYSIYNQSTKQTSPLYCTPGDLSDVSSWRVISGLFNLDNWILALFFH